MGYSLANIDIFPPASLLFIYVVTGRYALAMFTFVEKSIFYCCKGVSK